VALLKLSSAGALHHSPSGQVDDAGGGGATLLLAHVISMVCLPPLLAIATLVALTSHLVADPREAVRIALVSSFFVAIAPGAYVAYLLKRDKISGGVDLVLKEERLRPYLVGAGSCIVGLLVLVWLSAPQSITALALCYGINALVMALITQRWKISAHAAGAAMPLTALLSVFGTQALPFAAILPVVCWARVKVQVHTVAQVCAGALLGVLMTALEFALLVPRLG
jgi:hypothetical protein